MKDGANHSTLVYSFQRFMQKRGYASFTEPPIYWKGIPDVLCLKRDYKKRLTVVAEIKVSRSDFLQEIRKCKYDKSLTLCNKFYFVCPDGMIKPEEVPEPCGLYYEKDYGFLCVKNAKAKRKDYLGEKEMWALLLSFETKLKNLSIKTGLEEAEE